MGKGIVASGKPALEHVDENEADLASNSFNLFPVGPESVPTGAIDAESYLPNLQVQYYKLHRNKGWAPARVPYEDQVAVTGWLVVHLGIW